MREIKFRVWDKLEKKMYRVNAIDFKNLEFLELECDESVDVDVLPKGTFPEHFDLEQYTGLCDKHGKEIYEGDRFKFSTNGKDWEEAVIEFQEHTYNAGYYPNKSTNASCHWEIIGNIHTEPQGKEGG